MSARLILHIITTLILFALGWWLYIRIGESASDAIDATNVAIYWFASLVFIFFSWIFYWFVHRLKLKAWIISLLLAAIIAIVSTVVLVKIADNNQRKLENAEVQQQSEQGDGALNTKDAQEREAGQELETLNLSEEDELSEIENP